MTELSGMKCVACEGGAKPMTRDEAMALLPQVPSWKIASDGRSIAHEYTFKDFAEAFAFLTKVAAIAEGEGHHPNIENSWNKVKLELTTHAIGGLSKNDFILAAKIDALNVI